MKLISLRVNGGEHSCAAEPPASQRAINPVPNRHPGRTTGLPKSHQPRPQPVPRQNHRPPKRAIKLRPQPASQRAINSVPNRPPKRAINPVPNWHPSLFGSVSNPKLIRSHMIVFFETFIKMSCISKMQFFHNF